MFDVSAGMKRSLEGIECGNYDKFRKTTSASEIIAYDLPAGWKFSELGFMSTV